MNGKEDFFVHEKGLCESESVGPGTRIWAYAQVMAGAIVGSNCNICGHCFVETGAEIGDRVVVKNGVQVWDRVVLEDDVFVGPNVTFTNEFRPRAITPKDKLVLVSTLVKRGATICAGATVVCGITVGEWAFVAAGAVVINDAPAHAILVGNPARKVGWSCMCGERLSDHYACDCGRSYRLIDERKGLEVLE